MTLEAAYGRGSQLYLNQDSVKNKVANQSVLSRLRTLRLQVLSRNCFFWLLVFLFAMALTPAHGEEQTGTCKLMDPGIVWDKSSVVNFDTMGLSPCSSTEKIPMKRINTCIPHGHFVAENSSPDPLVTPIPSRCFVKVVMTVLAIIGLVGWMLYKRRRVFTEDDINRVLTSEPAVPRRSDPTFEIHPRI